MYCDRCGSELHDRQQFCRSCGKSVVPVAGLAGRGRVASNLPVLGILWLVYSLMHLLPGMFLASRLPAGPFWWHSAASGWRHAHFLFPGAIFGMMGGLLCIASVLGVIAGLGLLGRRPWARSMAIVFGCFALLNFPLGTALGVYTLWVLASSDSARQYREAV